MSGVAGIPIRKASGQSEEDLVTFVQVAERIVRPDCPVLRSERDEIRTLLRRRQKLLRDSE